MLSTSGSIEKSLNNSRSSLSNESHSINDHLVYYYLNLQRLSRRNPKLLVKFRQKGSNLIETQTKNNVRNKNKNNSNSTALRMTTISIESLNRFVRNESIFRLSIYVKQFYERLIKTYAQNKHIVNSIRTKVKRIKQIVSILTLLFLLFQLNFTCLVLMKLFDFFYLKKIFLYILNFFNYVISFDTPETIEF